MLSKSAARLSDWDWAKWSWNRENKQSYGFLTTQIDLFTSRFFQKPKFVGSWVLTIKIVSSTICSPIRPNAYKSKFKNISLPVATPKMSYNNFLVMVLPVLGNVCNAILCPA